ncbi:MAG: heparinase II/III family protein [Bacteroidota bacterium]
MKLFSRHITLNVVLWASLILSVKAQEHPNLILTKDGIAQVREQLTEVPLFTSSLESATREVDTWMEKGPQVPLPKDMAGGYSHEVHKQNFFLAQKAGALYQIKQEEKYASFVKELFMAYAKLYPSLGKHPSERSYARGKFFWQCLNDANWLVYMSQAYDCVYEYMDPSERSLLEEDLFGPYMDYISVENPQFFNRIHNHSTWGNAGVGMMALVMGDEVRLQRAMYGLDVDLGEIEAFDNDGGLIQIPGQRTAGFLAQLDNAFSPDGYYTEGPYYQRYAMSPFILFAQALENHKPELGIFTYRDDLLKKAVYVLLNLTDSDGSFYPVNDAQKGMSYYSRELISAVDAVYYLCGRDKGLLSIAKEQNVFQLDQAGFQVAADISKGLAEPFPKMPIELRDGAKGDEGAMAILRAPAGNADISCLFKYSAQGMGHGHFDRLAYSLYDGSTEVLQDYGSARWVNIDQKSGGGYLKENQSWAKQSLAHNTVVVDQRSQFGGSTKKANPFHADPWFFDASDKDVQIVSGKELNAYDGVELHRTLCLLTDEAFEKPILLDVFRVQSEETHQLDLPYHFQQQLMTANFSYEIFGEKLETLGDGHGYQHAWKEAEGTPETKEVRLGWFSDNTFYELTTLADSTDKLVLARSGASDPNFNIRRDAFFMLRREPVKDALFVSTIRAHGAYSPVSEIPINPYPAPISLEVVVDQRDYSIIEIKTEDHSPMMLMIANSSNDKAELHELKVGEKIFSWKGPVKLIKTE